MIERLSGKPKDYSKWEKGGEWVSRKLSPSFERVVERRVRQFSIDVRGAQNLDILFDQPCIIVANHPWPKDELSLKTGISPDSAIIYFVVKEQTGEKVHFLGNYGEKAAPFIKEWSEPWQERWKSGHKGIMKGYDMLSVDTTPGAIVRRDFIEGAERMIRNGDHLLIYPFGPWHEDDEMEGNVKRGVAYLSRRLNVPILPVYINGARTWTPGEKTTVTFGKHFTTEGLRNSEVRKKIEQEILGLRDKSK